MVSSQSSVSVDKLVTFSVMTVESVSKIPGAMLVMYYDVAIEANRVSEKGLGLHLATFL